MPPVNRLPVGGELLERPRHNLNVRTDAARPTELPQFLAGSMVPMHCLVYLVGVDLTRPISIQPCGDMFDQVAQPCLVVSSHEGLGNLPLSLGTHTARLSSQNHPMWC